MLFGHVGNHGQLAGVGHDDFRFVVISFDHAGDFDLFSREACWTVFVPSALVEWTRPSKIKQADAIRFMGRQIHV